MLDKGKGNFIEHLWIIQLCKADLNFTLHIYGETDLYVMLSTTRHSTQVNILYLA